MTCRLARLLALWCALTSATADHYRLGHCRPYISKHITNRTVTLPELVGDGDYTVLFTSGLKQLSDVSCAKIGYTSENKDGSYKFYNYVKSDEIEDLVSYDVTEVTPGKLHVTLENDEKSGQYIAYHKNGILLIYWCKAKGDDNFNNNIWLIAARTTQANSKETKKAVLEMLYHDDYKGLIDRDIEDTRDEKIKYVELPPCAQDKL